MGRQQKEKKHDKQSISKRTKKVRTSTSPVSRSNRGTVRLRLDNRQGTYMGVGPCGSTHPCLILNTVSIPPPAPPQKFENVPTLQFACYCELLVTLQFAYYCVSLVTFQFAMVLRHCCCFFFFILCTRTYGSVSL